MSGYFSTSLLWSTVAWPLILAIPAIHTRLPRPRQLALIPAALLIFIPVDDSLELPLLLSDTGLTLGPETRWLLLTTVIVWLMSASITSPSRRNSPDKLTTTFFLLCLSGNIGALLATDLVGFFSFTTMMGYCFYAFVNPNDALNTRHAGRLYLIVLVIADLALFESLLLTTSIAEDMKLETVRLSIGMSDVVETYIWIVFAAFALKSGIWPFHAWLKKSYRSASDSTLILLAGVPVTMAWLGAIRWLPLGENVYGIQGMTIQIIGVMAILHAVISLARNRSMIQLMVGTCMAVSGMVIFMVGRGLSDPRIWSDYSYLTYALLGMMAIFTASLVLIKHNSKTIHRDASRDSPPSRQPGQYIWLRLINFGSKIKDRLLALTSDWQNLLKKMEYQYQRIQLKLKPGINLTGWTTSISLFVLLGLSLALLAR